MYALIISCRSCFSAVPRLNNSVFTGGIHQVKVEVEPYNHTGRTFWTSAYDAYGLYVCNTMYAWIISCRRYFSAVSRLFKNPRLRVVFVKWKLKLNIPTILEGSPRRGLSVHMVYMGVPAFYWSFSTQNQTNQPTLKIWSKFRLVLPFWLWATASALVHRWSSK